VRKRISALLCAIAILGSTLCSAELIRPLNLGDTSFLDGLMFPQGTGWYFLGTSDLYWSSKFHDHNGKTICHSPKVLTAVEIAQFLYFDDPNQCLLGARPGVNLLMPIVASFNVRPQPNSLLLTQGSPGLGDVYLGGFLQWDPLMRNGKPFFGHRLELGCFFPIGNYDVTKALNPGTNTWSMSAYWAATLFLTEKWEASTRIQYLFYNSENHNTHIKAGRAFFFNLASSYEVAEKWRLGVNSYFLRQVSPSTARGKKIPHANEGVFAIGPGACYFVSENTTLILNYYAEVYAKNRFYGNRGVVLLNHFFR
jgi:anthranilate 1,2-dioxygenase (deaminating, decarboxylating) large subunit